MIICGDFNARSPIWWKEGRSTVESTKINCRNTYHDLQQLISTPTLISTSKLSSSNHLQKTHCPPPYKRFCGYKKENSNHIEKAIENID